MSLKNLYRVANVGKFPDGFSGKFFPDGTNSLIFISRRIFVLNISWKIGQIPNQENVQNFLTNEIQDYD